MEQIVRDTRIACLYEGTTEIQAIDLLGRKVLGSKGKLLQDFAEVMQSFIDTQQDQANMQEFIQPLSDWMKKLGQVTKSIAQRAEHNPDEVGAAAVDYLYFAGYVTLAYYWARMAATAQHALNHGSNDTAFYQAKISTAQFYFDKLLPRVNAHIAVIDTGAASLMQLDADAFAF